MNKVAHIIESTLIRSFINNEYKPNSVLPAEKQLAKELNVNTCSLRTVLKALESDGWISTRQGKPTRVNKFETSCKLSAGISRVNLIQDEFSNELLYGSLNGIIEINSLILNEYLPHTKHIIIDELENRAKSLDQYIEGEIAITEQCRASCENQVYRLLYNHLIPILEKALKDFDFNDGLISKRIEKYRQLLTE